MKCINKNSVVQAGQRRHVKAEREILMEVDSKFILKLYKTFRDDKYVYLLTEVLLGGELFTLMKRNGPLEEDKAKFAVACVVEAIGYLHDRNVCSLYWSICILIPMLRPFIAMLNQKICWSIQKAMSNWPILDLQRNLAQMEERGPFVELQVRLIYK